MRPNLQISNTSVTPIGFVDTKISKTFDHDIMVKMKTILHKCVTDTHIKSMSQAKCDGNTAFKSSFANTFK